MNKKKSMSARFIAEAAVIAALYVVLTWLSNLFGLASGVIQVRISEALTILPVFTPAAIPGLFIGCLISNTITGCAALDILFGSLATLDAAYGTYLLRKTKVVCSFPPVIMNMIVVPLVLKYVYGLGDAYLFMVATVGAGEVISAVGFGLALKAILWKQRFNIFPELAQSKV